MHRRKHGALRAHWRQDLDQQSRHEQSHQDDHDSRLAQKPGETTLGVLGISQAAPWQITQTSQRPGLGRGLCRRCVQLLLGQRAQKRLRPRSPIVVTPKASSRCCLSPADTPLMASTSRSTISVADFPRCVALIIESKGPAGIEPVPYSYKSLRLKQDRFEVRKSSTLYRLAYERRSL